MPDSLFDLSGKVAVITGGASGMGRAAALRFLERGARVVIGDLNTVTAEETLELARERGFGAEAIRFHRTDVSQETDIVALVAEATEGFGRLDCMFNNAGIAGALTPLTATKVEHWDRTIAILLRSVFLGIKHAARAIRLHGNGGTIINTSSTAGRGGGSGPIAYSAAKAGVENLTRNAAVELAPDRIRVNAIAPGGIKTPLNLVETDDDMRHMLKGRQPWPDIGQPVDIANTALFLASDESRFITGISILVDGGMLAWGPSMFPMEGLATLGEFSMGSTGEPAP